VTLADRDAAPPPSPGPGAAFPLLALALLVLLLAAAAAGVMLLLKPHLVFTNRLAAPVRLVVGEREPWLVAPGASVEVALSRNRTMVAEWELIRPLSADSTRMGEVVRGSSVLREPRGTLRVEAGPRAAGAAYFAPLVTNGSSKPLRVVVNAGLQGAVDCGCAVRPGGKQVFVGYYRLYQNSTVRAMAPGAGSATFRDLGATVAAPDGTVGLLFEDKDLRPR
jgi:hypothetical protein